MGPPSPVGSVGHRASKGSPPHAGSFPSTGPQGLVGLETHPTWVPKDFGWGSHPTRVPSTPHRPHRTMWEDETPSGPREGRGIGPTRVPRAPQGLEQGPHPRRPHMDPTQAPHVPHRPHTAPTPAGPTTAPHRPHGPTSAQPGAAAPLRPPAALPPPDPRGSAGGGARRGWGAMRGKGGKNTSEETENGVPLAGPGRGSALLPPSLHFPSFFVCLSYFGRFPPFPPCPTP